MTMVDREITDGDRIATLLRAEIEGLEVPPFGEMHVNEERAGDTEGNGDRWSFDVELRGNRLASIYRQDDRIYLDFADGLEAARSRAVEEHLRTRPKATTPPGLIVFVENGASVKRALDVLGASATDRS